MKYPKVILLLGMTLDGKIARNHEEFINWTGTADKKHFMKTTKKAGVVIMGRKTYDTIGKPLPDRKNIVMTRQEALVHRSIPGMLNFTRLDPENILHILGRGNHKKVCLIGGSAINTLFAKAGLIDEIQITVVPKIFGDGLPSFNESLDLGLKFKSCKPIGEGSVLMKYEVIK